MILRPLPPIWTGRKRCGNPAKKPGAVWFPLSRTNYVLHAQVTRGIDGHWRKNKLLHLLGRA